MIFAVSFLVTKVSTLSAKLECLTIDISIFAPKNSCFFQTCTIGQKVCQLKGIEKKCFGLFRELREIWEPRTVVIEFSEGC